MSFLGFLERVSQHDLPLLFLLLCVVWLALLLVWLSNTWLIGEWQSNCLQWCLASIPLLKTVVAAVSCLFWYSCLYLDTCSFWIAFGVFVFRIFCETVACISFLLISHGYCFTVDHLSVTQRRTVTGLGFLLYLTLTGYKAALPGFGVILGCVYSVVFYVILQAAQSNIVALHTYSAQYSSRAHSSHGGVPVSQIQSAIHSKACMLRSFQACMAALAVGELLMMVLFHGVNSDMSSPQKYVLQVLSKESIECGIFCWIGWKFRSQKSRSLFAPFLNTALGPSQLNRLPPVHRIEMDEKQFKRLEFMQWHIGVPISGTNRASHQNVLVIIQHPGGGTCKAPNGFICTKEPHVPQSVKAVPIPLTTTGIPL